MTRHDRYTEALVRATGHPERLGDAMRADFLSRDELTDLQINLQPSAIGEAVAEPVSLRFRLLGRDRLGAPSCAVLRGGG
jgi:hypothetical protein